MSEYAKEFPRRVVLVDPADNSDYAASGGGGGGGTVSLDQTTPGTTESVTVKASGGIGSLTETAPASDTASAALNGRLQRVAQRLTSLIALLPAALSGAGNLKTAVSEALPAGTNLLGIVGIDQTTPGTTNAVLALENSTLLDVTLSLDTAAYADGDVLADTQEVTGAVRVNGGTGEVRSIVVTDKDDQGIGFDLYFLKTSVSFGTENSAPNISDTNAVEILGKIPVASWDFYDLGGVKMAFPEFQPFMVKADSASTSIYAAAISRGAGTYTASGIVLKIGIARF